MKKFCFLFVVLLVSVRMSGQNLINYEGKFTLPESEKYVKLDFDFSETVFEKKYNEKDWNLVVGKEEWEEAKQEALERIVKMMNEKRVNEIIAGITAFSDETYTRSEFLAELLKIQNELTTLVFDKEEVEKV